MTNILKVRAALKAHLSGASNCLLKNCYALDANDLLEIRAHANYIERIAFDELARRAESAPARAGAAAWPLQRRVVSFAARTVLDVLVGAAGKKASICQISLIELAAATGRSTKGVQRLVAELVTAGLVYRPRPGRTADGRSSVAVTILLRDKAAVAYARARGFADADTAPESGGGDAG